MPSAKTRAAVELYREEKRRAIARGSVQINAARERLAAIDQRGNPFRRRTDPLRRLGAVARSRDPRDVLVESLRPYHGEDRPR